MVICIQRKKNLVCAAQSPKKIRGTHTYISPTQRSAFSHLLCANIPALDPPPRQKASFTEHKFCCQECFKTVTFLKKQKQKTENQCLNLSEACSFIYS